MQWATVCHLETAQQEPELQIHEWIKESGREGERRRERERRREGKEEQNDSHGKVSTDHAACNVCLMELSGLLSHKDTTCDLTLGERVNEREREGENEKERNGW